MNKLKKRIKYAFIIVGILFGQSGLWIEYGWFGMGNIHIVTIGVITLIFSLIALFFLYRAYKQVEDLEENE